MDDYKNQTITESDKDEGNNSQDFDQDHIHTAPNPTTSYILGACLYELFFKKTNFVLYSISDLKVD